MRAVVQRVSSASVAVDRNCVGTCGRGVLVLLGVAVGDTLDERFCSALDREGFSVATGVFGARMSFELVNDEPLTIVLD